MKNLSFNQMENLLAGECKLFPGNTDNHPFGFCFSICAFTITMSDGNVPWDFCTK